MNRTMLAVLTAFAASVVACSGDALQGDEEDDTTLGGEGAGASDGQGLGTQMQSLNRRSRYRRDAGAAAIDAAPSTVDAGAATADAAAPTPTPTPTPTPAPTSTGTTPTPAPAPAPTPTPTPTPTTGSPQIGGCNLYPADNAWNRNIAGDAVHSRSTTYIANMAPTAPLHADWGTTAEQYGIPINVGSGAPAVPITWTTSWGTSESDKLLCASGGGSFCYPIPTNAKIEGGPTAGSSADRHLLYLDTSGAPSNCTLYELYMTQNYSSGGFAAGNGAIFRMGSNALRPDGWTSGDAAGLPIMPGLVRYAEIAAGEIKHAIRFTMKSTQQAYIHPATHAAGSTNASLPPMGLRVRLKAGVNIANASAAAQVVLKAMKTYGLILADNGSNWYVTGDTNDGWSSVTGGIQTALGQIHGSDFEVVESGALSTNNL